MMKLNPDELDYNNSWDEHIKVNLNEFVLLHSSLLNKQFMPFIIIY